MNCTAKTRSGQRCGARALRGSKRCVMHTGKNAQQFGSKGGRRRAVYAPGGLKQFAPPQSARDLRDLLAEAIIETRAGRLDPRVSNSVAYLGAAFLRAVEVGDLETRLAALEKSYGGKKDEPTQKQD
jgi:hypothetical protein